MTTNPAPVRSTLHTRPIRELLVWNHKHTATNVYSRDRVAYRILERSGIHLRFFRPHSSPLADIEALFARLPRPDAVWVPSFRHRDVAAAARYCRRNALPLIFDPLISAYDKQVNERAKFAATGTAGRRLLRHERALFGRADIVIADTTGHAEYFADILGVEPERIVVLPVGADESVFQFQPPRAAQTPQRPQVLFFGSFIGLHGVPTIIEAILHYAGPPIEVRLIGDGPAHADALARLGHLNHDQCLARVRFENWVDLETLAKRIAAADIVLGIFGTSAKALRVVPNKVYQALAVGRPVITADTPAYDARFRSDNGGAITFSEPGNPQALAQLLAEWAHEPSERETRAHAARRLFDLYFAESQLQAGLIHELETRDWGRRLVR